MKLLPGRYYKRPEQTCPAVADAEQGTNADSPKKGQGLGEIKA